LFVLFSQVKSYVHRSIQRVALRRPGLHENSGVLHAGRRRGAVEVRNSQVWARDLESNGEPKVSSSFSSGFAQSFVKLRWRTV